jgi:hypothetical protein
MIMRLMAIAVFAAFALGAVASADAAPRKRQDLRAGRAYAPVATYVMHRDEQGRTRTKILVQKRSYLDGGTEVMPGDIQSHQTTFIDSFYRSPSRASVSNDNIVPSRPIPDPFFLPGKNNPYFY